MIEFNAPIIIEFSRAGAAGESVGVKDAKAAYLVATALEAQGYQVKAREYLRTGYGLSAVPGWTAPSDGYYPSKMLSA